MTHIKLKHGSNKEFSENYTSSASSTNCEVIFNDACKVQMEKAEIYECEICGKHNSREDSALKHKATHGITDKLKCENCPTEFTLRKNYMAPTGII